jgi:hypothetical protein
MAENEKRRFEKHLFDNTPMRKKILQGLLINLNLTTILLTETGIEKAVPIEWNLFKQLIISSVVLFRES